MEPMPLPPNAVAYLDQLEADTLALIRIGRDGTEPSQAARHDIYRPRKRAARHRRRTRHLREPRRQ